MRRITVYDTEVEMKNKLQKSEYVLSNGQVISVKARYVDKTTPFFSKREMHHWKVSLMCNTKELEVPFYTGILNHSVTAERVLGVLNMEAWAIIMTDDSYEDWCDEFGNDPYEPSSHLAYGLTYMQVRNLQTFLGAETFQAFLEDLKLRGIEDD